MSDFVGKDKRGFVVVLTEDAWLHAEPHHEDFGSRMSVVMRTLTNPDLVLENKSTVRTVRSGNELYCRYEESITTYIAVPVKILETPQSARGYGTIPAGTRLAVTAYTMTAEDVQRRKIVWSCT